MKKKEWRKVGNISSAISIARNSAAIYVIGTQAEFEGLPINYEYAYIGQSTNLSRRLKDHLPQNEKNMGLRRWLIKNINRHNIRFAYFDKNELDIYEQNFIKYFKPTYNKLHNSRRINKLDEKENNQLLNLGVQL